MSAYESRAAPGVATDGVGAGVDATAGDAATGALADITCHAPPTSRATATTAAVRPRRTAEVATRRSDVFMSFSPSQQIHLAPCLAEAEAVVAVFESDVAAALMAVAVRVWPFCS